MEKYRGLYALVTGASRGIGAEICRLLVKNGMIVIGIARNIEPINKLAQELSSESGKLHAYACDLCDKDAVVEAYEEIEEKYGPIDVLVNNASMANEVSIMDGEPKDWRNMLYCNVLAPTILCQKVIVSMMEREFNGHIINVGATSSHTMSIYPSHHFWSATKYGLRSLTEGFSMELKSLQSHIKLTHISPGNTKTEFLKSKKMPFDPEFVEFKKLAVRLGVKEQDLPKKNPIDMNGEAMYNSDKPLALSPKDVADYVLYALSAPEHAEVSELTIRPIQTY